MNSVVMVDSCPSKLVNAVSGVQLSSVLEPLLLILLLLFIIVVIVFKKVGNARLAERE